MSWQGRITLLWCWDEVLGVILEDDARLKHTNLHSNYNQSSQGCCQIPIGSSGLTGDPWVCYQDDTRIESRTLVLLLLVNTCPLPGSWAQQQPWRSPDSGRPGAMRGGDSTSPLMLNTFPVVHLVHQSCFWTETDLKTPVRRQEVQCYRVTPGPLPAPMLTAAISVGRR